MILIAEALQAAGYDMLPTVENLTECYLDYADSYGRDLDEVREDIADGTITVEKMCMALIRCH